MLAKGILLPANAPAEYADRGTLWNAVENSEKQWNAQLARDFIIALPRELPKDQYELLIRDYCQQQFVSQGMIADYAIHDKGDGNPHAHIMLTMRAMDERGKWLPKARKVYDLDENGNRIKLPSGNYKSHKKNTVDWNDPGKAEIWRSAWADLVNEYLERAERPERIDLRSYARQGKEQAPTMLKRRFCFFDSCYFLPLLNPYSFPFYTESQQKTIVNLPQIPRKNCILCAERALSDAKNPVLRP